jgi:hypothetical protein
MDASYRQARQIGEFWNRNNGYIRLERQIRYIPKCCASGQFYDLIGRKKLPRIESEWNFGLVHK